MHVLSTAKDTMKNAREKWKVRSPNQGMPHMNSTVAIHCGPYLSLSFPASGDAEVTYQ